MILYKLWQDGIMKMKYIYYLIFINILKKLNYKNLKEKDAHMRMPLEKEKVLEEKFKKYKEKFCK